MADTLPGTSATTRDSRDPVTAEIRKRLEVRLGTRAGAVVRAGDRKNDRPASGSHGSRSVEAEARTG